MRYKKMMLTTCFLMIGILICAGRIVWADALKKEENVEKRDVIVEESVNINHLSAKKAAQNDAMPATESSMPATPATQSALQLKASYRVMNQKAIITIQTTSSDSIKRMVYLAGKNTDISSNKWDNAIKIKNNQFSVSKKGNYSILAENQSGNKKIVNVSVVLEMKAVWLYFDEIYKKAKTPAIWKKYIDTVYLKCKKNKMNTVILQVRPCADAMYPSKYYPWSKYATGTVGKNPGFDPLSYAVSAAHKNGLSIHAWINPYRITLNSTKISKLPKNSIARKWAASKNTSVKRRVLKLGNQLYFNPSSIEVQNLVANGVKEIVKKYKVDGIHMDDYFYPTLGSANYKKFDYSEYKSYVKKCKKNKKNAMSLVSWRRDNVNKMVRKVYSTVKAQDKKCIFGISPAGNITNLYSKTAYYSPVKTWMNSNKYIDYICPQIYWSFTQKVAPYKTMVKKWTAIKRSNSVNLYIGLAGYRAGISSKEAKACYDTGWSKSSTILKRQVEYGRSTKKIDGFVIFSYGSLTKKSAAKEIKNLMKVWNAR